MPDVYTTQGVNRIIGEVVQQATEYPHEKKAAEPKEATARQELYWRHRENIRRFGILRSRRRTAAGRIVSGTLQRSAVRTHDRSSYPVFFGETELCRKGGS